MTDDTIEAAGRQRYAAIRAFYVHVLIFMPVLAVLAVLDMLTGSRLWMHWVGLGWGLIILVHGWSAFVTTPRRLSSQSDFSDRSPNIVA